MTISGKQLNLIPSLQSDTCNVSLIKKIFLILLFNSISAYFFHYAVDMKKAKTPFRSVQ